MSAPGGPTDLPYSRLAPVGYSHLAPAAGSGASPPPYDNGAHHQVEGGDGSAIGLVTMSYTPPPMPAAPVVVVHRVEYEVGCGKCKCVVQEFRKPQWSCCRWFGWLFALMINQGAMATALYFWVHLVIGDGTKPVKGVCTNLNAMRDNVCILAVGQVSYGVIAFGQLAVGLVTVGQLAIGILFCVGQLCASMGAAPLGQLAFASYIYRCQVGIGLIKVGAGQLAVSIMAPFFGGECIPTCGACNRRRR